MMLDQNPNRVKARTFTMIRSLTTAQQNALRRCREGLRVWETQSALVDLMAAVQTLRELELVELDDDVGYLLTAQGTACLLKLGL